MHLAGTCSKTSGTLQSPGKTEPRGALLLALFASAMVH